MVAGTIFTLDGGIVLLKRDVEPAMGKWVFPGGYVDRGESVQEAAIRETKEESHMDVKLGPLLNVYSYPRSPNIIVVYAAQVVGESWQRAMNPSKRRFLRPRKFRGTISRSIARKTP